MIKRLAMLLAFSLAYPVHALADDASDRPAMSVFAAGMAQNHPDGQFPYPPPNHDQAVPPAAAHGYDSHRRSFGQPLVVIPMPLPNNSVPGFSSTYGLQYPGSYMPRDTPLHRFNGYVTCDPPDLSKEAPAGTTSGTTAQRLIKITSTRSLAAPAQSQPCPVYTINGEIPKQKSYNTTTTAPFQRPAPPHINR
jgi:hypothetical protein